MKVIIVGDFGGTFSRELFRALKNEKADSVLGTGDYASIKRIGELFLRHGKDYPKYLTPELIEKVSAEQARTGMHVLKKLHALKTPCFLVLGNNDWRRREYFKNYIKKSRYLTHAHDKLARQGNMNVYGWSNLEHRPREHLNSSADIKYLDSRLKKIREPYVFLTHFPPKNCALDINLNKRRNYHKHVGDKAVNHALWHHRPAMILCGHLEEHTGECMKRNVRVVNPGAAEKNQYAVMEFDGDYTKARIVYKKVMNNGRIVKPKLTATV